MPVLEEHDAEGKEKWCSMCGNKLPLSEFHRDPETHDGFKPHCRSCRAQRHQEDRAEQQDKRLCTLQEWRSSCGPRAGFDPDRCNTVDADGFGRDVAPTGSFPQCRSNVGTYDMIGNVHEWVQEQQVAGGDFDSDESTASCNYSSAMRPGQGYGNVGFRCCADPH